jgi:hypothetical protein
MMTPTALESSPFLTAVVFPSRPVAVYFKQAKMFTAGGGDEECVQDIGGKTRRKETAGKTKA